jgi:O-6-methylguanine DNA methyltransferase
VREAARQLEEFFEGTRTTFQLTLHHAASTAFQASVWKALGDIPYGEVRTYAEVARAVNRPKAARAVGNANHANPWPIIVPCHRVVASTGLGGYGGGEDVKRFLLALEGVTYD